MSNIYNIDYNKLIANLIPTFLRKRTHFDWLVSLFAPINLAYADFKKFRNDAIYRVTHNSQVYSIENVFNDRYDKDLRRVYITDAYESTVDYIYRSADNEPQYLGLQYIYRNGYFSPNDTDFLIVFPKELKPIDVTGLAVTTNDIKTLANYYKLASKRYEIVWI